MNWWSVGGCIGGLWVVGGCVGGQWLCKKLVEGGKVAMYYPVAVWSDYVGPSTRRCPVGCDRYRPYFIEKWTGKQPITLFGLVMRSEIRTFHCAD
jgi:hypothetical protein